MAVNNSSDNSPHHSHITYILETFEDRDRLYTQFELFYPAFEKFFAQALELAKVDSDKQKFRVLDAGCGEGLYTDAVAKKYSNANVVGIDRDVEGITTASMIFSHNPQLHFHAQDLLQPVAPEILTDPNSNQKPALFDIIFASMVVVHNKEPLKVLENLRGLLRSGGVIYLIDTAPNLWPYPDTNYQFFMNYLMEAGSRVASPEFATSQAAGLKKVGFEPAETTVIEYPIGGPTQIGQQMLRNAATIIQNTRRGILAFGLMSGEDFDRRMIQLKDEINPDAVGTWTNFHTLAVKI